MGRLLHSRRIAVGLKLTMALVAVLALGSPGAVIAQTADLLSNIARDGSAVLGSGAAARLVLTETDHGVEVSRILAIGDEYLDGWSLEAIAGRSVTLSKGAQKRTFALLGRPIPIGTPPPVQVSAPLIANAPPPRPANPAPAAPGNQAMEAARVAQQAGASVQEIARVYTSLTPNVSGQVADPSSARWVTIGGQPMIAMVMRDPNSGRETRMMMAAPDRERAPPVAGLPTLQDLPPLRATQQPLPPIPIVR
jgi:hypothetical protein